MFSLVVEVVGGSDDERGSVIIVVFGCRLALQHNTAARGLNNILIVTARSPLRTNSICDSGNCS